MNILEIKNLNLSFRLENGLYKTLYDINLSLKEGEIHALVGESGCGKTMTAMSIIKLLPKNAVITDGEIIYKDKNLLTLKENEMRKLRGSDIALIPQDPMTSLNPLYTIGNQLLEVIKKNKSLSPDEAKKKAAEVLSMVKIPSPKEKLSSYPHELSGGMKQRVIIAMALAANAKILIADEPTTALDVTIQAQIMKILCDIKKEFGTSIILISHDLGLVGEYADEISVMYSGRIVEQAPVEEFFRNTLHPYSRALLSALPANTKGEVLKTIDGQPPDIRDCIAGCRFSLRCKKFDENICVIVPQLRDFGNNHYAACHNI
ncbi:MAG: ABC transporter ATP-binding protein [Candidatus Gastranaerophilales bacterium]|nr:ABC transporter ATP-binding protein [Candidatus Gastranaerophilales bacterium]